jgi:hypothetical protein
LLSSCELHLKYLVQSVSVAGVLAVAFAVLRKRARSAKAVNLSVGASEIASEDELAGTQVKKKWLSQLQESPLKQICII